MRQQVWLFPINLHYWRRKIKNIRNESLFGSLLLTKYVEGAFVAVIVYIYLYIYIYIYGIWIYNYPCYQCISPLMLCVRISIRARCTTLCDKVCQWLATDQWFSPGPPVSSSNKTDRHDITEILLKWIFVLSSITGISSSVISVLSHKSLHTIHIVTLGTKVKSIKCNNMNCM
jgi:hypothetical protein